MHLTKERRFMEWETTELIEIIARCEDSRNQFKENFHNVDSLAAEIVAFSNSGGGRIIIGIEDVSCKVKGLTKEDVSRINLLISNAATQSVRPPINPVSENIVHPDGLVIVLNIPDGISKPYMDNKGAIWVKMEVTSAKLPAVKKCKECFNRPDCFMVMKCQPMDFPSQILIYPFLKRFFRKNMGKI